MGFRVREDFWFWEKGFRDPRMSVGQRVFVFSVPEAINDAEAVSPKPEPCITDTVPGTKFHSI